MLLKKIDHVAIICSNYERSKDFYTRTLGLRVIQEIHRAERKSFKLDLAVGGSYQIEIFSFPDSPARTTNPEACGLRHLAFQVDNLDEAVEELKQKGVLFEEIRFDEVRVKRFCFFFDPDGLPVELCEI